MQDIYWSEPQASYKQRRRLYLQYCAPHSPGGRDGFFSQITRLELGQQVVDEGPIREAIRIADKRLDCSDFCVAGLLRILYLYRDSLNIDDAPKYGLSYDNIENGLLFWSIRVLLHPKVFALSKRISKLYGVRQHEDYEKRYNELFQWQIDQYGWLSSVKAKS